MIAHIQPSSPGGTIIAPASKSSMQRACAAALIHKGISILHNPGKSNDDIAALNVIKALGATVDDNNETLTIASNGVHAVTNIINNGESGLGIRMFTPLVALNAETITIYGEGSLLSRPMDFFDEVLPQLNVQISSSKGKLPLHIKGPLIPQNITIDGSLSSQFLTGLLMAYSAAGANNVTITVNNLTSKPYIDLTLKVMKDFGLNIPQHTDYKSFLFTPNTQQSFGTTIHYTVEGDWSGGAFLLVAGAIAGNITVKGLAPESTQADKKIMEALKACNANMLLEKNGIVFTKTTALTPFTFDATDCPDLFPPLAALAACCHGISTIQGVNRLAHKESNRGLTIQEELSKMNIKVELQGNIMYVHGGNMLQGAIVSSHHDHRIAMMCATAALQAKGNTTIHEADAINKSYPDFYKHMKSLGVAITIE